MILAKNLDFDENSFGSNLCFGTPPNNYVFEHNSVSCVDPAHCFVGFLFSSRFA